MAPDDGMRNIRDAVRFIVLHKLEIDAYWQCKIKGYMKRLLNHKNMFLNMFG